jgi:uroporphyrinogen decarboxylase
MHDSRDWPARLPAFAVSYGACGLGPIVRGGRDSLEIGRRTPRPSAQTRITPRATADAGSPAASPAVAAADLHPQATPAREEPLLLRAARGEAVERPPVWLMRQAGRYMADFRSYSDRMPFRVRSETPDVAFELSMQPYRSFGTDGVIMFSDILTPLPAVGVDFDISPGKGPVIENPIRTAEQVRRLVGASFEPAIALPFVATLLERLTVELASKPTTLLGFVGAPFTLASYAIEGRTVKTLVETKRMMYGLGVEGQDRLQTVVNTFADLAGSYAVFQIDHGAQVIQFFDSWAHHLSPAQYKQYALPAARRALEYVKRERPNTPVVFFANGCAGKLEDIVDALGHCMEVLQLDWSVSMKYARKLVGNDLVLQGNVDPAILLGGSDGAIRDAVRECIEDAGQQNHILNLGHGVIKETPEQAVATFCDEARKSLYIGRQFAFS